MSKLSGLQVLVEYLDDQETTVTILDGEERIIEVYLRRVMRERTEHNPDLKPYDLSFFSDEKNFNVVTPPKPQ